MTARTQAFGLAELPVIYLEHPLMSRSPEEIGKIAASCIDAILSAVLERGV